MRSAHVLLNNRRCPLLDLQKLRPTEVMSLVTSFLQLGPLVWYLAIVSQRIHQLCHLNGSHSTLKALVASLTSCPVKCLPPHPPHSDLLFPWRLEIGCKAESTGPDPWRDMQPKLVRTGNKCGQQQAACIFPAGHEAKNVLLPLASTSAALKCTQAGL